MIKGVERVSIAVKDLGEALRFYRDALGFSVSAEIDLSDAGLKP